MLKAWTIARADSLYPSVALGGTLGWGLGLVFLIGLLASAFSSADSAMTALTTSICVDVLKTERRSPAIRNPHAQTCSHRGCSCTFYRHHALFKSQ